MFLEKLGKFFFFQMRPAFFFVLIILPLFSSTFFLLQKNTQLQNLESRFASAARKEKLAMARKERKERFLERYSHPDPYYLDQKIESYPLLQQERKNLECLLNHPAFPDSQKIQERLSFLNENRLEFTEEKIEISSEIKDVQEKQRRPVQMDENDLRQILSLIEDLPVESIPLSSSSKEDSYENPSAKRPQILIKEFNLKKQETALQTEVFEVEMDLLKREYIQS
jgi:hypothetical protein